ncbi:MAG: iron ABC transporter permease [Deltaproteobacteria bacterium]|nr:iron ABC transporter permease [Deltaproteobacteria bacterium]
MKTKSYILIVFSILISTLCLFIGPEFINPFSISGLDKEILLSIRVPRLLTSLLIGSALGVAGAILQGVLRNPLADPYILGISSGSALFAVFAMTLGSGLTLLSFFSLPFLAFLGAMTTGVIVGLLSFKEGRVVPERLLLAGIGLGFLFSSALILILSLATELNLRRAMLWLFGDLSLADYTYLPVGVLIVTTALLITILKTKALNALALGDDIAFSLGFSPSRERLILFTAASLMTAAAVSLGGIIGFIGLLIPHIVRFSAGSDARILIPLSAITGAAVLCVADTIARTVLSPTELPSGIITALIGAPYFLYLLRKKRMLWE